MTDSSNNVAPAQSPTGVGYGRIQKDIFRDRTLPPHVKLVYACLATYADAKRIAFPSRQTIANDTGLSLRAVGKAVKQAEAAGLLRIVHTQTSNRYQLHDLNIGGYVLGSGPGGTSRLLGRHTTPSGEAPGAHEQDQTTRPESDTSFTSSDAFAAAGRRTSSTTISKIYLPGGFDDWAENGEVVQHLVACAMRIIKDAGIMMKAGENDRLASTLMEEAERGYSRAELVAETERIVARTLAANQVRTEAA